jgi:hypothetical protein
LKYEEYLTNPDIHQEFDLMFEKERDYYRVKSREFGIKPDQAELFSIKIAYVSTDIHFTKQFYNEAKEKPD